MYSRIEGKFIEVLAIVIGLSLFISQEVFAQTAFPSKPIKIVVCFAPGGTTDLITRALSKAASRSLGQQIVVTNTPGAGGTVALSHLMKEKPDGYNLATLTTGAISAQYMQKLPFKLLRDFTPVVQYVSFHAGLVVRVDSSWKTFNEFIHYTKANPGKVRYSTGAVGLTQHLIMERLGFEENIKWTHVPFDGGVLAATALLGGHVDACAGAAEWKPYVDAGSLRLLAVFGEKRIPHYPDVPTLKELGYNISGSLIASLVGPKGIPADRLTILDKAFKEAMNDGEFNQVKEKFFMAAEYRGPEEFARYLEQMDKEIETIMRRAGLTK